MGDWIAFLGDARETALSPRLLGSNARIHAGNGYALGITDTAGEPARLIVCPDNSGARVYLGDPADSAGSEAVIHARGGGDVRLTLRCDPFGLHGIVYGWDGDAFWCASDQRLLRRSVPGLAGGGIDPAALHGYLCFSHVPTPQTIFTGISCLPAGTRWELPTPLPPSRSGKGVRKGEGSVMPSRVSTSHTPFPLREGGVNVEGGRGVGNPQTLLRAHLQRAVESRLGNEGREVGVFLSGGLDSSLVAALLVEAGAKVRLFTLDFGPPHDIEVPFARRVAEYLRLPLHLVPARPRQIRAALDATACALPQPFGDAVTIPLYLLGQAAKEFTQEVWNGEGGDQLFGGWANKPMLAAAIYSDDQDEENAEVREYLATYHRFHGLTDRLYTPLLRSETAPFDPADYLRPALDRDAFPELLHRLRAANLRLKGAQNIAPRCVALAAAHGLRVRAPFFDRALAEWTFTLPPAFFLNGPCEKFLLKQVAAETYLPPEIVWREKRGMGVPASDWYVARFGVLRGEARRRLSPRRLRDEGWFDPAFVAALLRGEDPTPEGAFRRRRVGEKIGTLLMLQAWRKAHAITT